MPVALRIVFAAEWVLRSVLARWHVLGAGKIISGILATEGVGALFRGALPRALWVAPLGAMNFAGYEVRAQTVHVQELRGAK